MVVKFLSSLVQRMPKKNVSIYQPMPRFISYQENPSHKHQVDATGDTNNFRLFYPVFKKKVLRECYECIDDEIEMRRTEKVLDYNLPSNRQTSPLMMVKLYRVLQQNVSGKNPPLEDDDLFTLGWLIETAMLPGFLLDDVLDSSVYRRGKPCWYTLGNNEKTLPLDAIKISLLTFGMFTRYFGDRPFYRPIAENFTKTHLQALMAQTMDRQNRILMGIAEIPGYYYKLCAGKALFYVDLPIKSAIYLAGCEKELKPEELTELNHDLGYFVQVVNDYIDHFGTTYDDGTKNEPLYEDIRQGQINWFLENAMLRANDTQKQKIRKCYGRMTDDSVREIVSLYNDLGMHDQYNSFVEEIQQKIRSKAASFPIYFQTYVEELLFMINRMRNKPMGKMDSRESQSFGQN